MYTKHVETLKLCITLSCFEAYADLSAPAKRPGFKGPPVKE
jgi:hypothetical protein